MTSVSRWVWLFKKSYYIPSGCPHRTWLKVILNPFLRRLFGIHIATVVVTYNPVKWKAVGYTIAPYRPESDKVGVSRFDYGR